MFILYPHYKFKRIDEIPTNFFVDQGITTLLLDVDNTLTGDNDPNPIIEILDWIETQRKAGIRLMIISNNYESRVAPFAKVLDMEYIADAKKPKPDALRAALRKFGVSVNETALIGDQLFTDILCARLAGCMAVLVEPMKIEDYGFYRVKRRMEKPVLSAYDRKQRRKG